MNSQKPIYTETTRCQDCYKCVRHCPVKAIKVEHEIATVMDERCIFCGTCVNVCPVGAKKVRDDLGRARLLLKRKERVYVSLAPSFLAEFPGVAPGRLIGALRQMGFAGVSETALGAELVSAACARELATGVPGLRLSTACPTVVELIRKYHPTLASRMTGLLSPLLAHCKLLRETFGQDIGVVFIGPCVSKKLEAAAHPELLDVALTFSELHRWMADLKMDWAGLKETPEDRFVPGPSHTGALYPIDGGMNKGIQAVAALPEACFMHFSGIPNILAALDGLERGEPAQPVFLELLACEGGCVNGPRTSQPAGTVLKRLGVIDYERPRNVAPETPELDIQDTVEQDAIASTPHTAPEITTALRRVGKTTREDELNCGGCGYDSCRSFAAAFLEGRAEPSMCVSYMRKLALNKANALIRAMPSGVVIVDEALSIIECNRQFAELLGEEAVLVYEAMPGMAGASLVKVAPFHALFSRVLEPDAKELSRDLRLGERILRVAVFPIEPGRIVGGIVQDITAPAVQRDQIIEKAQDVIRKNVTTVQQIAYLLGENAAESEMILDSIIASFKPVPAQDVKADRNRG